MKRCYKCGFIKDETEFSKNLNNNDELNRECKECQKAYFKEYYKNNKDKHIKTVMLGTRSKRQAIQKFKVERGCARCGFNKHPAALHFHHIDKSTKKFGIGNLPSSHEDLIIEIEKCEILCANCHALEHADPNWYRPIIYKKEKVIKAKRPRKSPSKPRVKKDLLPDHILKELLWEMPSEEIAKKLNVSGSYLSKYCKKRNIEKPPRGYWRRKEIEDKKT